MLKITKRQWLAGVLCAGAGIVGAALFEGTEAIIKYTRILCSSEHLDFTVHVLSAEQAKNSQCFAEEDKTIRRDAQSQGGYLEIRLANGSVYMEYDVFDNHFFPIARNKTIIGENSSSIMTPRKKGKTVFDVHTRKLGEYRRWTETRTFMDNDSLLKEILKDAQTNDGWRYRNGKKVDFPSQYALVADGVNYRVYDLDTLVSGDRNTLTNLWTKKVGHNMD